MKKTLFIALLCATSIAFSQEQKVEEKITITTELKFGKYTDCLRPGGICTFNVNNNKSQANTAITYNKDNTITLIIERSKITKADEVKILGQELTENSKISDLNFAMEDDFNLEPEIKSSLKMAKQIAKIVKGNYPIQITKDHFIITLNLE